MLQKKIFSLFIAGILAFSIGCSGTEENDASNEDAQKIGDEVLLALQSAMEEIKADASSKSLSTKTIEKCEYNGNPGWTAEYEVEYGDPTIYTIHIEWNEYSYGNIILSDGTIDAKITAYISAGTWTYTCTGEFLVTYNEETYDFSWEIQAFYDGTNFSYSGTYTIDGVEYSY